VATGVAISLLPDRRAPWDLMAGTVVTRSLAGEATQSLPELTSPSDLRLGPQRVGENRRARRMLQIASLSSVLVSGLIVWNIFSEAWQFVSAAEFSWTLLTDIGWFPRRDKFDLSTLFVGTLWITGIAMLVAGPIGIGVAIYLSEYATPKLRGIVKPAIETLAGIPSVVLGFFAISFISPSLLGPIGKLVGVEIGIFSLLSAGIAVGVLTVPIVASISEDAMRAVPRDLREASYGLGARRATTALRVVFPAALSGISAAFIVGVSRAIGETMVVFIAAGGSGGAIFEADPTEPGQTITAAMASLGAGTDSVAGSGIAFQSLYFLGALLFIITLVLNVLSGIIVRRFRQVY
ncbi:MAG: phosphate ABC transporter permease subunit PstC, partial [Actinomycetia bacterium]|nr:phosphate ABC transporter permease subunit PstC [Actinomycetes bacterium]